MSPINVLNNQKVQANLRTHRRKFVQHENKAFQTQKNEFIPIFKSRGHQIGESHMGWRHSPTKTIGVQKQMPDFNKDLWDLQFSRWWGWNWMKKQEEENIRKRMVNKRNNTTFECPHTNYITPRIKIEPYRESKLHQFLKLLKHTYTTVKTKLKPPRFRHNFYITQEIPVYHEKLEPQRIIYPQQRYLKHTGSGQKSISSLFLKSESRRKKYKRKQRSVDSWIVEKDDEFSSSEEEETERVLTCMSVEETYTTSAEGDVNYLAARMKNVCNNSAEVIHKKPRKLVSIRNKRTQTIEDELKVPDKNTRNTIESVQTDIEKIDIAIQTTDFTEKRSGVGLIEKNCFASPLSGHLYNINIPDLQIVPEIKYPNTESIFDTIKETDISDLKTLTKTDDREHQRLLSAVFDALLSSKEQPLVNYYYDDTFKVTAKNDKKCYESESKTKNLYTAPFIVSSSSYGNILSYSSDARNTATDVTLKRKSSYNAQYDVTPVKTYKKSSSFVNLKKQRCRKSIKSTSSSNTTTSPDVTELPVILEDDVFVNNIKIHSSTNPFLQKNCWTYKNNTNVDSSKEIEIQSNLNTFKNSLQENGNERKRQSRSKAQNRRSAIPVLKYNDQLNSKKRKLN